MLKDTGNGLFGQISRRDTDYQQNCVAKKRREGNLTIESLING